MFQSFGWAFFLRIGFKNRARRYYARKEIDTTFYAWLYIFYQRIVNQRQGKEWRIVVSSERRKVREAR